ncbi:hypothetical protein ACVWY2_000135 [Bradyrhizobium sp. JR6.1]
MSATTTHTVKPRRDTSQHITPDFIGFYKKRAHELARGILSRHVAGDMGVADQDRSAAVARLTLRAANLGGYHAGSCYRCHRKRLRPRISRLTNPDGSSHTRHRVSVSKMARRSADLGSARASR